MLRSKDIELFSDISLSSRNTKKRKCDRITQNTKIPADAYLLSKTIIIDSGITLSFLGDIQLRKDTKFIFPDNVCPGKVIFYGKVFGEYNVSGGGIIVKCDLPAVIVEKVNDEQATDTIITDDVVIIGDA